MKKMVMVADTYPPKKDGVITYLRSIIPYLKNDYQVTLIAPRFSRRDHKLSEGIEIFLTPSIPIEVANYYPAIPNTRLARVIRQADTVFVHDLAPLGYTAILIAAAMNKPITIFCHHDESVMLSKAFKLEERRFVPDKRIEKLVDRVVKRSYKHASLAFVATGRFLGKLDRINYSREKVIFSPFAVDTGKFRPGIGENARKRYGIPPEAKVILYLGRMSHEKNVETIINSIPLITREFRDPYFVFAGGGARLSGLKKLAAKAAPGANIIFTDWVEWEKTPEVYSMGDIFLFPSFHETQAFVVMEAMASGLAVVAPRDKDIHHSYYEENRNCLFLEDPGDANELARKALLLLKDDNLRESIQKNARLKMEGYSWEAHYRKLKEGFQRVESIPFLNRRARIKRYIYNKYVVSLMVFLIWYGRRNLGL